VRGGPPDRAFTSSKGPIPGHTASGGDIRPNLVRSEPLWRLGLLRPLGRAAEPAPASVAGIIAGVVNAWVLLIEIKR
jgi:hypothetical protein